MIKLNKVFSADYAGFYAIIAVEIASIFMLAMPFASNNLLVRDTPGHYYSAVYLKQNIWPMPIGWDGHHFFGMPLNQFYGPLLSWTAATLGFLVGIEMAFKLIVISAVLIMPLALYYAARAFGYDKFGSAIIMLGSWVLMASIKGIYGFNFHSVFNYGFMANAVGIPLLFFYLGQMKIAQKTKKHIGISVLLALTILTHILTAIAAILVFAAFLITSRPKLRLVKHITLSFLLAGFWLIPFIAKYRYSSVVFNPEYSFGMLGAIILLAAVPLSWHLLLKRRDFETAEIIIAFGLVLLTMVFGVFSSLLPQTFRLFFLLLVFMVFMAVRSFRKPWQTLSIAVIFIAIFFAAGSYPNAKGIVNVELVDFDMLDGRAIVPERVPSLGAWHAFSYMIPAASGSLMANGIYMESTKNYDFVIQKEIIGPKDGIFDRLKILNINYVIASEDYRHLPYAEKRPIARHEGRDYYLYKVGDSKIAEVLTEMPIAYAGNWDMEVRRWFFSANPNRVLVHAENLPSYVGKGGEKVEIVETSRNIDYIKLRVDADDKVPVYIKISEFPNWNAYVNGVKTKIYKASPYFMLVYGNGIIELKYGQTMWDILGWAASLAGIIILCLFRK